MKLEKIAVVIMLLISLTLIGWGWQDYNRAAQKEIQKNQPSILNFPLEPTLSSTQSPTLSPVKIIFGGDMMFDRDIRRATQKYGQDHVLGNSTQFLTASDLVVANLEGPITDFNSRSINTPIGSSDNYVFTFDPQVIKILQQNNIQVVNLGNNHILNFGQIGLQQTQQYLQQAQLRYFGHTGGGPANRTVTIHKQGITIGFINYNQFIPNSWSAVETDLKELRPLVDVLIVYTHWGNEYQATAGEPIVGQAHQLIDLGADAIIGSHPHVVQQKEVYHDKTIYYSLGNFVFDQYFQPEVQVGLLVTIEINPTNKNLTFSEQKIKMLKNGQTILN